MSQIRRLSAALALCAAVLPVHAAPAQRVVTLAPHLAELVCAAGACARLVGVVAHSDFPPAVEDLPQVGDAFAVSVEQVVALEPDLVLAWAGGTPPELQERLRSLGLRVEALEVRAIDDVATVLRRLGSRLGTATQAGAAAAGFEVKLAALRSRFASVAKLRVLYQIENSPIYTVNRDSPISQAIELCGGRNIFADLAQLSGPVSREAVLARNPEVIVFARQDDVAAIRAAWQEGPPVAAMRADTLYAIDADTLVRATPRLLEGAEALCAVLEDARKRLRRPTSPSSR